MMKYTDLLFLGAPLPEEVEKYIISHHLYQEA